MACDIVLTVYNNLAVTQRCVESILKNFRKQDTLVIVDNASDQETRQFLQKTAQENPDKTITVIRLEPNQGFIKAANAGLKRSTKDCVCLLSNDTVVTSGWLDEMERILENRPDIGIIGPSSNTYGLHPKPGATPQQLADTLIKFKGEFTEAASCVGFCMLIRKTVLEKIGFLDEIYGLGYFEDTDYCRRAIAAGFRCVIAKSAYVWHKEHSTFKDASRRELFKKNKEIFCSRWGEPRRLLYIVEPLRTDKASFTQTLDTALASARAGNWVWIAADKEDANEVFKKARIHGNIKVIFAPRQVLLLKSLFFVVMKRKKKIDCVYIAGKRVKGKRLLQALFCRHVKEITHG